MYFGASTGRWNGNNAFGMQRKVAFERQSAKLEVVRRMIDAKYSVKATSQRICEPSDAASKIESRLPFREISGKSRLTDPKPPPAQGRVAARAAGLPSLNARSTASSARATAVSPVA